MGLQEEDVIISIKPSVVTMSMNRLNAIFLTKLYLHHLCKWSGEDFSIINLKWMIKKKKKKKWADARCLTREEMEKGATYCSSNFLNQKCFPSLKAYTVDVQPAHTLYFQPTYPLTQMAIISTLLCALVHYLILLKK